MKYLRKFFEGKKDKLIEDFIKKHSNKYDYSMVDYIDSRTNIDIVCPIHGKFSQNPYTHKMGSGCPSCGGSKKGTKDSFIENAKKKHGDFYDYSKVNYVNSKTKVDIVCPIHGVFSQTPNTHITKSSKCPKCSGRNKNNQDFINDANRLHSDKYDYSKIDYKDAHTKVDIVCPKHGIFNMSYNSHVTKGYGCPKCIESSGESYIVNFLLKNNIVFEYQKKFIDCKYKKVLVFDFFLPDKNLIIEYDGRHHFMPIWGGDEGFNIIKKRDEIKNNYCIDNNISIIRIKYSDDIDIKLKEIL